MIASDGDEDDEEDGGDGHDGDGVGLFVAGEVECLLEVEEEHLIEHITCQVVEEGDEEEDADVAVGEEEVEGAGNVEAEGVGLLVLGNEVVDDFSFVLLGRNERRTFIIIVVVSLFLLGVRGFLFLFFLMILLFVVSKVGSVTGAADFSEMEVLVGSVRAITKEQKSSKCTQELAKKSKSECNTNSEEIPQETSTTNTKQEDGDIRRKSKSSRFVHLRNPGADDDDEKCKAHIVQTKCHIRHRVNPEIIQDGHRSIRNQRQDHRDHQHIKTALFIRKRANKRRVSKGEETLATSKSTDNHERGVAESIRLKVRDRGSIDTKSDTEHEADEEDGGNAVEPPEAFGVVVIFLLFLS